MRRVRPVRSAPVICPWAGGWGTLLVRRPGARVTPAPAAAGGSASSRPLLAGSPHPCAIGALVRRSLVAHKSLGGIALRVYRLCIAARCARRSWRGGRRKGSTPLGICGLTARRSPRAPVAWSAALGARGTLPPACRLALRALVPPCALVGNPIVCLTSIGLASAGLGGIELPPSPRPRGWRIARGWGSSHCCDVVYISASRSARSPSDT